MLLRKIFQNKTNVILRNVVQYSDKTFTHNAKNGSLLQFREKSLLCIEKDS